MNKLMTDDAWNDLGWWEQQDRKTCKRIRKLVTDIERDPFSGLGKPEPLRGELAGKWSRRINQEDRIVYEVEGDTLIIYSMKDHYSDR